ncbi:MAG: MFS transporter, partial [Salinirussus sp.]
MPADAGTGFRRALAEIHADGRSGALVALGLGWFFVLGLRFTVPALLPFITRDFPVSNAAAGGAITILWLTYAGMQFPAGALVDRVGERRLLTASAFLSAASIV